VTNPNALVVGTEVMAPIGDVLHRGVISEPPVGQTLGEDFVFVRFTPPMAAAAPFISIEFITCPASRVTLGWF
jgi:hypothetical protein